MRHEMNILAMAKGADRFVFLYDDESHEALIEVLDQFALNPKLNFSIGDAALLGQKARDARLRSVGIDAPTQPVD